MSNEFKYNSKDEVIQAAKSFINENFDLKYSYDQDTYTTPETVASFLLLNHDQIESETFSVMFLDSKHKLIKFETLFTGSINSAQIYPRTTAIQCLKHNAAAVIFCHHHPSGDANPSQSDIDLTASLKQSLALIDVKVLDHFVLAGKNHKSMAAHQMM